MKKTSVFAFSVLLLLGCENKTDDFNVANNTLSVEQKPVELQLVLVESTAKLKVEVEHIEPKIAEPIVSEIPAKVIYVAAENFSSLPANAAKYLPILREVSAKKWPEFATPSIFAAQTEKESCINLKHKNCWSPYAEFKTSREYGFGFGQITIAYKADGKVRFNKFEELKQMDSELKNWQFVDRYNAYMQFLALVVLNKINYKALANVKTKTETDKIAMMLAAYNGGLGGITGDIRLCKNTPGCDPERWFGHVETTTKKSKSKVNGYGNSMADINRLYPFDILYTRREKYLKFFDDRMIHKKLTSAPHKF